MVVREGGCSCGAVRYQLTEVTEARFCHCAACRRATGAPVTAWAVVPAGAHRLVRGEPREHRGRAFCGACGTPLHRRESTSDDLHVPLGTLDDPASIEPVVHVHVEDHVRWLKLADLLPTYEGPTPAPPSARTIWRGPADPTVTRASAVTLRPVDAANVVAVLLLDVQGGQRRYVATNAVSLAQAHVDPLATTRAICAGETPVGFVMLDRMTDDRDGLPTAGDVMLRRFLVDDRYQGLGFGTRALTLAAEDARAAGARHFWATCVLGHHSPIPFYLRFGFVDTGVNEDAKDDGERYLRYDL